jgi:hypothetical protein
MTDSFFKLCLFKTAYSPVWEEFVEIVKVRLDEDGVPLVEARVAYTDMVCLFRQNELTNYVL